MFKVKLSTDKPFRIAGSGCLIARLVVAAWLSGKALVLINVVALRRARLVLGYVTVRGYTILVFNQSHPGLLSLAIPTWVGTMSTGGGLGHR